MQKRVLQIVHGYNAPFFELGNQYGLALQRLGYEVTTVYLTGARDASIEAATVADQVCFLSMPSRALRGLKLRALYKLMQLVKQSRSTTVIAHRYKAMYLACILSQFRAVKVFGVAHAFGVFESRSRRLLVRLFGGSLTILGVSEAVRDDMRRCLGFKAEAVQCLHNAVNLEQMGSQLTSRRDARQFLGIAETDYVIANVGRLHTDKDQKTLINAFARVCTNYSECTLLIMGSGKLEAQLKAQVDELGITERVIFTGRVANGPHYFRAFDLFVLSSDKEPFGMVLIEAMLAGLPIISTDCGGAPEVTGDTADYFQQGNVDQLEILLRRAIDQRKSRETQGYAARLEDKFSLDAFTRTLNQWLEA